jgi:hypothetical protein
MLGLACFNPSRREAKRRFESPDLQDFRASLPLLDLTYPETKTLTAFLRTLSVASGSAQAVVADRFAGCLTTTVPRGLITPASIAELVNVRLNKSHKNKRLKTASSFLTNRIEMTHTIIRTL